MKIMKPLLVVGATDFDYNPEPNPEVGKAAFALADLASPGTTEEWADAGVGARNWERAGRPTGTR